MIARSYITVQWSIAEVREASSAAKRSSSSRAEEGNSRRRAPKLLVPNKGHKLSGRWKTVSERSQKNSSQPGESIVCPQKSDALLQPRATQFRE